MAKKEFSVNLDTLEVPDYESEEEILEKPEKNGSKKDLGDADDEMATLNKQFKFGEEEVKENVADWDFLVEDKSKAPEAGSRSASDDEDEPSDSELENENESEDEKEEGEEFAVSGSQKVPEREEDTAEEISAFFELLTTVDAKNDKKATFASLSLSRPVLRALAEMNYTVPTPIQKNTIPVSLMGKDIVAGAETGSGKTAAYVVPIIERLLYKPSRVNATRVIILTPTRELSIQVALVAKKLAAFCPGITFGLAVGGLNLRKQEQELKKKPDIVIATPGRLIDHIRNSPSFSVDSVQVLVMDEADRMLEEGFQKELTEILSLVPRKRQTLLFSATMNLRIQSLVQLSLDKPVRVMVDAPTKAALKLTQEFVRVRKREDLKPALLACVAREISPSQRDRIVVFVSRKETAKKLRVILGVLGLKAAELHGSLSQEERLVNVERFKKCTVPILVCTDLAARGLDIPKIAFVINYDMPKLYEVYLHRVGRTARANREGRSVSFVGESNSDRGIVKELLKALELVDKKGVSRKVDWEAVEKVHKQISEKTEEIELILEEEKAKKEIEIAERDIKRGENLLKHQKEILSRPKRSWFEKKETNEKQKKKFINSKKRKRMEEGGIAKSKAFVKGAKKAKK